MMAKMLKRLKKDFPNLPKSIFWGREENDVILEYFFKKRHPLKDFWKEGREGRVGWQRWNLLFSYLSEL